MKTDREHEPVAWMDSDGEIKVRLDMAGKLYYSETNVYAAPPKREWVGLTDEDVTWIMVKELSTGKRGRLPAYARDFAKAVEAKLKEKNNG